MKENNLLRMDNVGIVVNSLCYIRGPEGILIGLAEQLTERRSALKEAAKE